MWATDNVLFGKFKHNIIYYFLSQNASVLSEISMSFSLKFIVCFSEYLLLLFIIFLIYYLKCYLIVLLHNLCTVMAWQSESIWK